MHVHEQRAAADDLEELGGPAAAATSADVRGSATRPPAFDERGRAPAAAMDQTHYRGSRDEAAGGHRCSLHGRNDGPALVGERGAAGSRGHHLERARKHGQRIRLARAVAVHGVTGVPLQRRS